jgi:hypothetical protein
MRWLRKVTRLGWILFRLRDSRFYLALSYRQFGALDNSPAGQTHYFLCKRLAVAMEVPSTSITS